MSSENTTLLKGSRKSNFSVRKLFLFALPFAVVCAYSWFGGREGKVILSNDPRPATKILYQDWRGLAQEQDDVFTFVHSWSGSVIVGESEENEVDPDSLKITLKEDTTQGKTGADGNKGPDGLGAGGQAVQGSSTLSDVATALEKKYKVSLKGNAWELTTASALLSQFDDLCGSALSGDQSLSCGLDNTVQWFLTKDNIADDVTVENSKVSVSAAAFDYAVPRKAVLNGTEGVVFSLRLQHAVMRAITDFGHKASVVNGLLLRKFNSTLLVDVGYTKLTSVTTYEDKGRFMKFKPRELMYMLEAWSQMPQQLQKVPGLKYVTRRQQGLNHPYYGATTAVSWPTNLAESYQEYMDYSFNNDGYTSKHLFLHEKTHFLWGRVWDEGLKTAWYDIGHWTLDTGTQSWMTESSTAFVSDYGAGNNPNEDIAEDLAAYILHPRLLLSRAPAKHAFLAERVMGGERFVERAEYAAQVVSGDSLYRYPPTVKKVSIRVTGAPEDEKLVEVELVLAGAKGWLNPVHVDMSLTGPSSGSISLSLKPKDQASAAAAAGGAEEAEVRLFAKQKMSKYLERGFWSARQMTVEDGRGKQRWIMVDDYSWRLYLNNAKGTTWAPRYLKDTMKLSVSRERDAASGKDVPVVTATVRYQQTGAPLPAAAEVPIWMRLAAQAPPGGGAVVEGTKLTYNEWAAGYGAAEAAYPIYQQGTCVADKPGYYDGTCTVKWTLSPYAAAGYYYVPMLSLKDEASNTRNQLYTVQRPGWTCCGRTGNMPNDEPPTLLALPACAGPIAGAAGLAAAAAVCVEPDTSPPELDLSSISVSASQASADGRGGGAVTATFRARDDKSGVGAVRYRIIDPQGFSHDGWVDHPNAAGPVFTGGDPAAWQAYTARLDLPAGSPGGAWQLESVQLHDKAGNRRAFQLIELLHFRPDSQSSSSSSSVAGGSALAARRGGGGRRGRGRGGAGGGKRQPWVREVPVDVDPAWEMRVAAGGRRPAVKGDVGVPLPLAR